MDLKRCSRIRSAVGTAAAAFIGSVAARSGRIAASPEPPPNHPAIVPAPAAMSTHATRDSANAPTNVALQWPARSSCR